ncbi:polyketide synthase [Fusarium austroafricanum]|uniref:Polyketide synthase n=1 Tax=Fusarium austroafricanum TaxID=2364996 RepID=A0A8H4K8B3_9HYPO|nr:polyketide synthase [Fusarium austroafricanum]
MSMGDTENPSREGADTTCHESPQHNDPAFNKHIDASTAPEVAICGIALRLPGGISNCDDYWHLLYQGLDARRPVASSRYNIHGFDDSLGGKEFIKAKHGYFIEDDLSCLDTSFFTLTKSELDKVDPQQRLLLEVTRECLDDAGETNYRGKQVGCYVGTFGDDWLTMNAKDPQGGLYEVTGAADLMMANRISYEYDFRGPSLVVKSGCSASTIALHEACRAIQRGDASSAIVGGANLIMAPTLTASMSAGEVLAPDASCKVFDAAADGYARAEAITAVYIKPLADALRDGNPIRAIVKATAVNCDGMSASLVTPNGAAHESLMRKAYRDVGLDPKVTAFVECHGTGTPTGDPIETAAVGRVFGGEKGIYITSVKANLGHSEGSAGLSSVIKCVLALEHQIVPPQIKMRNPNPKIPFLKYNLNVPLEPIAFPSDRQSRVSINSFGIGGSNAHVILESYPSKKSEGPALAEQDRIGAPQLLLLSANSEASIQRQMTNHQEWAIEHPGSAADLGYTLAKHRQHLPHRSFLVLDQDKPIETFRPLKAPSNPPQLVLVFSGQGAQWPGMARELVDTDYCFRNDLIAMNSVLQKLDFPPNWNLMDELLKSSETSRIHKAELSQPLCTAIQLTLFNKFSRLGLSPSAIVGHSSGEIAGAYSAGQISMEEAIVIAYYRGHVTKSQALYGSMAAIGMGTQAVSEFLSDGVVVACENSPDSTTISGDADQVSQIVGAIKKAHPDILARLLKVDMAYHSHHMMSFSAEYQRLLNSELSKVERTPRLAKVDMFSSVTTELADESVRDPSYWSQNLTSTVQFSSAVSNLVAAKQDCVFLEIGPHSTLAGPLKKICSAASLPFHYISSQSRGKDSSTTFVIAVGTLYQHGLHLDLAPLFPNGKAISGLPPYPWDHSASYWSESRISKAWRSRQYPQHCLLGSRTFESSELEPQWRNILNTEDLPWLLDHKLRDDVVFPFAGYIAMAGEATRQVSQSPCGAGYCLHHVIAHKALLLPDLVELSTSLHNHQLNDSQDSSWYDFTISSYNGSTWSKHCTGQVRVLEKARTSNWAPEALPRVVDCTRVYGQLAHVGFIYGPKFRGLLTATSSTSEELAFAKVENRDSHSRSPFTMHPATIDASLQLLMVTRARGLIRNMAELAVPTSIEEVEVSAGADVMDAKAWKPYGAKSCVELVSDDVVVLHARGIQLQSLGDDISPDVLDVYAAARLSWLPHFDFADISTLVVPPCLDRTLSRLLEKLALLFILETAEKISCLEPCQPHFSKFRDWINKQVIFAAAGDCKLVNDSKSLVSASSASRLGKIDLITAQLLNTPRRAITIALRRLFDGIESIFTGNAATIDTLLQDNLLADVYTSVTFDYSTFFYVLSHTRPTLRVLEIGAGTGGTTDSILQGMPDRQGIPAYSVYTFTDISAGFFPAAKTRFSSAPNMEFKVLDISQNPLGQGFEESSYDLVIAANVLHATPSLHETLSNIRLLLKPDGILVMTEACSPLRSTNYIFGNFSGWWLGEEDDRFDQPYVSVSRWHQELKSSGYSGVEAAVYDDYEPYRHFAAIIAKKEPSEPSVPSSQPSVTLISENADETSVSAPRLATLLESNGWKVTRRSLGDDLPEDQDIISCLELERSFFEDTSQERFSIFQEFSGSLGPRKVLWLMPPTQVECSNPASAQTLGVTRTLRSELGLNFSTLEIDPGNDGFGSLVSSVFEKIIRDKDSESLDCDKEYIVKDGAICVGRYQPVSLVEEASNIPCPGNSMATLHIVQPGIPDTTEWRETPLPETIPEGHVEIEVRSCGLNFHDVISAMGLIPHQGKHVCPGLEVSGVVKRLGSSVTGICIGDRVMAFLPEAGCSTHVVSKDDLVHRIPEGMSFEEAATVQTCFSTVVYALLDIGKMRKGTSVLVHSACGGVGLAAIQVIQMMGGDIYATVGDKRKRDYLVENHGIPQDHIFSSRDASFLNGLMQQTDGRGVDLVLNSLSGELLHTSWKCVAKFGVLLELGKRDLTSSARLDMSHFLDNRSYCGIDMHYLLREQSLIVRGVMERILEFYKQEKLGALKPITQFDASDARKAIRYLQGGQHIGKVILNLPHDPSTLEAKMCPRNIQFDSHASYLLVGGLGGLGRALAIWLVERGAKSLVFLSRSGIADDAFSAELKSMACLATVVKGSVNALEDVNEAIRNAPNPIKGVFHLAMVQKDSPFLDIKWTDWNDVNEPKVRGTWNLHRALHDQPLDHFWLASSTVTVVDQAGQGSYKAGLLSICGIEDVGYLAEHPAALRSIKQQGMGTMREKEFLECVEASLRNSTTRISMASSVGHAAVGEWSNNGHIIMGLKSDLHLDDPKNRTNWRRDRRMGAYHNLPTGDASDPRAERNQLKMFLQSITTDDGIELLAMQESIDFLGIEIGTKINDFLLKPDAPIDLGLQLSEMGLDSLTAIELRRWFRQVFGLQMSVLEMIGAASLKEVAEMVATRLAEKLS